jgi:hypothetical protein
MLLAPVVAHLAVGELGSALKCFPRSAARAAGLVAALTAILL